MSKIDISIIVPIYNAEKYLRKCLDSLIHQTKKELEFILVNDGSKDQSEKIIKSYQDDRIKYFKNTNHGIGYTRNYGIQKATGKYIMFLDSDDYLELNACEELVKKAEKEDLDVVVCDFYKEYDNGNRIEEKIPSFQNTTLKETPQLMNQINLSPWNKIYKSSLIKDHKIQFVEDLKYEDAPFVLECLEEAKRIGKLDRFLNHYIIHSNSETTVRDERCFDIIKIVDQIRKYFKEKKQMEEALNQLTVRILTNYTIQQRVQQDKKIGMKFIEEAFSYLEKEVPDYKKNKYYQGRGLKRIIEKNKFLTKLYVKVYK